MWEGFPRSGSTLPVLTVSAARGPSRPGPRGKSPIVTATRGFLGTHELKIDDKGRLSIPARFKNYIKEHYPQDQMQVVVGLSLDKNLRVYPRSEFDRVLERYDHFDDLDADARDLANLMIGMAVDEKIDGAGRIRLDPQLRRIAGLDREVTLVGTRSSFDVWPREQWDAKRDATLENMEGLIDRLRRERQAPSGA